MAAGLEAVGFELAVYRLGREDMAVQETVSEVDRVVHVAIPGGARAWTPGADACLTTGNRYAWLIRSVSKKGSSEWSEPLLFQIEGPSESEVREAVAVLRSYLAREEPESGQARLNIAEHEEPQLVPTSKASAEQVGTPAPATIPGVAAIDAELTDTTGEIHGVVGISNSVDGAGLAAENSAGGTTS